MVRRNLRTFGLVVLSLMLLALGVVRDNAAAQSDAQPIQVCATVPELGSLAREVGGEQVSVTTFGKGTEDPHFVEAKPSFIKALSQCELYMQMGMELEMGWAPVLLQNARNGRVLPGTRGYLDASTVITPLEVPTGPVDRSMGDVHPAGNPHFLLDPLNGLKVGRLIRDKLIELRPERRRSFEERYEAFRQKLGVALVGEMLAQKYDAEKLALLYEAGRLADFLKSQGDESRLGGWLGALLPYYGAKAVADHNMWPYFARRFGISVVEFLEPKPGLPPTTKHLNEVIELMRAQRIKLILANPYFDPRAAQFVAQQTGAKIINVAHQVGAREGTDEYLKMVDYNVRQLVAALRGAA
jgi:ABC-type Zn uptake system ZnuABC Zn-binding protein ZnuA